MVHSMKRQWTQDELAEHWTLLPDELKLLANKTGATRLGFSLLLKTFACQGRFPRHMHELPGAVIVHVADIFAGWTRVGNWRIHFTRLFGSV
jgi:hypothetical protein